MKHGEQVKRLILDTGLRLWETDPKLVTANRIAKELNKTHASILYHFPKNSLRDAVAQWAVVNDRSKIIVYLILEKHKAVESMSDARRSYHFNVAS